MDYSLPSDLICESFNALWQHSPDGWFLISVGGEDFCYLAVNDVYARHFGLDAVGDDLASMPLKTLLPAADYEMRITPFRQCLRQGRELTFELQTDSLATGVRDWQIVLMPLRGHGGRISFLLGQCKDLTEQKQQARQLRVVSQQQLASDTSKSAFIANISHEMRTPVDSLSSAVDLLMNANTEAEQRHMAELISASANKLSHLMEDILDFARLSTGALKLDYQRFSLYELLQVIEAEKQALLSRNNVHLRLLLKAIKDVYFYGDAHRVGQLLDKLIDNAIKFTHQGEVLVSTQVTIKEGNARLVTLRVKDTGCGIATGRLDEVFKPFRQLDESTTRLYGGAGLGLAIVKQLVELMRGDISVVSDEGQGTEFVLRLPLLLDESRQSFSEHPQVDHGVLQGAHVLVVEDNPINKLVAERLLQSHGLTVTTTSNGAEAIDILAKDPAVDIVVMDWHMPQMDGAEATRRIRAMPDYGEQLPIIGLTASIDHEQVAICHAAGMNDVLGKPIESKQLIDRLAHWLTLADG